MASNYAFTGVGNGVWAAGMSRTLHVAAAAAHPVAHPAFVATAAPAAAVIPQRKRRTAATAPSVDRGTI